LAFTGESLIFPALTRDLLEHTYHPVTTLIETPQTCSLKFLTS
jgi:hypothetical protein